MRLLGFGHIIMLSSSCDFYRHMEGLAKLPVMIDEAQIA
jgi:hypothetical protein